MSRKHFQAIADEIKDARLAATTQEAQGIVREFANRMADVCQRFNTNFDRGRFLTACGY